MGLMLSQERGVAISSRRRMSRCRDGKPEVTTMLRKTLGWAASLALVYVVLNSLPDVIRYVKISRM